MQMMKHKTVQELLSETSIERHDAELLLAHVCGGTREQLIAYPEKKLTPEQTIAFNNLASKRADGFSVAVLLGRKEFFGREFMVTTDTLIPRPDTEVLVENAIQTIQTSPHSVVLIDIGTGTACIPISIYKNISPEKISRAIASDISKPALEIAQKNIQIHNMNIFTVQGNLFEPFMNTNFGCPLIITANLPYLTQKQFDTELSIQKEPQSALVAADNGHALIFELITQIASYHTNNAQFNITLFLEIDPSQTTAIKEFLSKKFTPSSTINIIKDLSQKDRVIKIIFT